MRTPKIAITEGGSEEYLVNHDESVHNMQEAFRRLTSNLKSIEELLPENLNG